MNRPGLLVAVVLGVWTPLAGCDRWRPQAEDPGLVESTPTASAPAPPEAASPEAAPPEAASTPSPSTPDYFKEAMNRATSAVVLGQSAQSPEDWQLAVGRWQQAIDLMTQVPAHSPNFAQAQTKIQDYQRSLATAQQRAAGQSASPAAPEPVATPNSLVAQIPIRERRGGIPMVDVTFQGQNGAHRFPMMFDTGASGTLITAEMAHQIGVVIIGSTPVKIADGSTVNLPIGYVDSIEAGGLRKTSMVVAVGGSIGLLGQDFYGEFGIAMGSHVINLHR